MSGELDVIEIAQYRRLVCLGHGQIMMRAPPTLGLLGVAVGTLSAANEVRPCSQGS